MVNAGPTHSISFATARAPATSHASGLRRRTLRHRHRRARRRRPAQCCGRGAVGRARPMVRADAGGRATERRARIAVPACSTHGVDRRVGRWRGVRRRHVGRRAAREKEFGILDRLTKLGIEQRFPEQAEARARVGKFYFRPPGGESWCDVILRLRSVFDTISLHHSGPGKRVLIVAHQVIVLCCRYLLEGMDEAQILAIDRERDVANCGVTWYTINREHWVRAARWNSVRTASWPRFRKPVRR